MAQQQIQTVLQEFQTYVKRMKALEEAAALIFWDLRTGAPKRGAEQRAEVVGMLSGDLFKMSVSEEMGRYLDLLSAPEVQDQLDEVTRASVKERREHFERSKKIPADKYQAYVTLCSKAEYAWQEAKANNDFETFRPYLEQIIATLNEFVELWGYEENKYDALLEQYEPGMTVKKLDALFNPLRDRTVSLLKEIRAAKQIEAGFLYKQYPVEKQREFCEFLLRQIGYDFDAGRLDVSAHPFMININTGDVRVTTGFREYDLQFSLFSTIHEGGHALYEQNMSPELNNTFLATGASMGVHESQSRFWENMIGRSYEFWSRYYGDLVERFPEQLNGVTLDEFYKAVNLVEPLFIRIDSDELTYNLHILLRYEIEKDLINGLISVADLPKVWAEKMESYLGIVPETHGKGVLQDIHWSCGSFGYFPTYTLGNIYAAQLENAMRKELPDYKEQLKQGDFSQIKAWLTDKVYRHGKSLSPEEIILQATGEEANVEYLIRYLEDKFKSVYGL
jgi:carboxypeptidase Taq